MRRDPLDKKLTLRGPGPQYKAQIQAIGSVVLRILDKTPHAQAGIWPRPKTPNMKGRSSRCCAADVVAVGSCKKVVEVLGIGAGVETVVVVVVALAV